MDAPGERLGLMSLLDESLKISQELGMRPLMERALSRREIWGRSTSEEGLYGSGRHTFDDQQT